MTQERARRRNPQTHRAILDATRELLLAGGYERLSIEGIAARAGVGKQTLYRWWPTKAAIVAEAVIEGAVLPDDTVVEDSGDTAADLRGWLHARAQSFATPTHASLIRALTCAAADDRGDARRLYQRFTGPHQAAVVARLRHGVDAGQVRPDVDLDAVADALIGALLFQLLAGEEAVSPTRADGLLRIVLPGLLVPSASATPPRRG